MATPDSAGSGAGGVPGGSWRASVCPRTKPSTLLLSALKLELHLACRATHRYPFLLVDRVVEWEKEKYAVGYKCVTANDNFFPGHFPERPIMPGEALTDRLGAWLPGRELLAPRLHHTDQLPRACIRCMDERGSTHAEVGICNSMHACA